MPKEIVFVEDSSYLGNCEKCCYNPWDAVCHESPCMPHLRLDKKNGHFEEREFEQDGIKE